MSSESLLPSVKVLLENEKYYDSVNMTVEESDDQRAVMRLVASHPCNDALVGLNFAASICIDPADARRQLRIAMTG